MGRVLVTGGVRSGKSHHAESLFAGRAGVRYVAPGPTPDDRGRDADWAARVAAHRARRPADWSTLETLDLASALTAGAAPVLVDSLGTWLAGGLDVAGLWEAGPAELTGWLDGELDRVLAGPLPAELVVVSDEVGLGGVAAHPSARRFADLLGLANQRVAAVCDEVHLVVAGRVLRL